MKIAVATWISVCDAPAASRSIRMKPSAALR